MVFRLVDGIFAKISTIKPVKNGHSKKDQKMVFKTDYRLMQEHSAIHLTLLNEGHLGASNNVSGIGVQCQRAMASLPHTLTSQSMIQK